MIRPYEAGIDVLNRVVDGVLIITVLFLATYLYEQPWLERYTVAAMGGVVLFYLFAKINDLYQPIRFRPLILELKPLLLTWGGTTVALLMVGYVFKTTHEYSRVVLGLWMLLTPLILTAWRYLLRLSVKAIRRRGYNTRSVAIVGDGKMARELARNLHEMDWTGLRLKGFFTARSTGEVDLKGEFGKVGIIGDYEQLIEQVRNNDLDIVYIALPSIEEQRIAELLEQLSDTTVSLFMVPDYYAFSLMQGKWFSVGDVPTVSIIDSPMQGLGNYLKRSEDIALSILFLLLSAVPMLLIAIGIKLTSPGPVFYRQRRYGLRGERIEVLKFRSMKVVESDEEFRQAQIDDDRVTPFGAWLRKTSLDELPQFINVLKGEMSIVGPRPHAVAHNEEFRGTIYGYMLRHTVKPGITGWAQVNGYRGGTETKEMMENRVRYDMEYINNWSVWFDLKIILRTPMALLRAENAY